jgi:glycosyltransferase involved in cell wall biosynthesis
MHLVIVSPYPPTITGVGQYGYHVTRALAESGQFSRITVLAVDSDSTGHPNHFGLTEILYCSKPGIFNAHKGILSQIKKLKPDVVWFNMRISMFGRSILSNLLGMSTPNITREMGYPTIVTLHEMIELADLQKLKAPGGPFASFGARFLAKIVTKADVICLTMRSHVDWITTHNPKIDCVHIPLGAVHEPILLDESSRPELLLFNMLAPFKGIELLLDAYPLLKKEYPALRLKIAGVEHPRFPGYLQTVKRRINGLVDVEWVGKVADEDIVELFRQAQIIVLPYMASTGASSVLYQAATWGRAVVASNLKEIRTLAQENNFQLELFESGNVESLQMAIRKLLNSPSRRYAQTENNFNAIQSARLEITSRRYIDAFNRALEKHKISKHQINPSHIETKTA